MERFYKRKASFSSTPDSIGGESSRENATNKISRPNSTSTPIYVTDINDLPCNPSERNVTLILPFWMICALNLLSFSRMSLLNKRKRPEPKGGGLVETDRMVLNVIKSKKELAIWTRDLKKETNLPDTIITKSLKNLQHLSLIKEVAHVQMKGRKHYIAAEFEPSTEITGGSWYANGSLDTEFIDQLKSLCLKIISRLKVATADGVYEFSKTNSLINTDCTSQQISEILRSMVLDNIIIDVKSTGLGEYHSIPVGKLCYRCPEGDISQAPITGAMASIPCGVCPRIRHCTPDGLISPSTCVYYTKWLDF